MEYGLSLALGGALVHAKEVDYGLPKEFQIVCPACREPIFKVGSTITKREYFAHYRRQPDSDCELRVQQIAREHFDRKPVFPRGQQLEQFLRQFEAILLEGAHPQARADIAWMCRRPSFRQFLNKTRNEINNMCRHSDNIAWYYAGFDAAQGRPSRPAEGLPLFGDILAYLVGPNAFRARAFGTAFSLHGVNAHLSYGDNEHLRARFNFQIEPLRVELIGYFAEASDKQLDRYIAKCMYNTAWRSTAAATLCGALNTAALSFLDVVTALSDVKK